MRLLALADTHGRHRSFSRLPEADVFLHAGDFTKYGSGRSLFGPMLLLDRGARAKVGERQRVGIRLMSSSRISTVYTVGVYGSTREAFFDALKTAGIDVLLDIRRRRAVRGSIYSYANAERLTTELTERGIAYKHVIGLAPQPETLAIQSAADEAAKRLKSQRTELAPAYIEQYVSRTLETFDFAAFVGELQGFKAPALFCIERIPQACHRSLVAPKLAQALGIEKIVHLIPEGAGFDALRFLEKRKRRRAKLRKMY